MRGLRLRAGGVALLGALFVLIALGCAPSGPGAPAGQPSTLVDAPAAGPYGLPAPPTESKPSAPAKPAQQPSAAKPAQPAAAPAKPAEAKPGAPVAAAASTPAWQPDPQLLAAAKAEKEVVWYAASTQVLVERGAKRFEEITGISVEATRLSAGPIRDRFLRERQTGLRKVDVVSHGNEAIFLEYKQRGVLEKYAPKGTEKLRKDFLDADGMYHVQNLSVAMIAYNPRAFSGADIPKRWADAIDPKYRGKVAMADPRHSGVTLELVAHMAKLFGWQYFEKLKANQVHLVRSAHELVPLLVSGERPLAVGALMGSSLPAKQKGSPLEIVFPEEGTYPGPAPAALVKDAPHPSGAKLLLDFLFSQEYQALLLTEGYYPVRDDVPLSADVPSLVNAKLFPPDAAEVGKAANAIRDRWADIFGG